MIEKYHGGDFKSSTILKAKVSALFSIELPKKGCGKGFRMAAMKDVARRAGVSKSTVSHVLNNTRSVSEVAKAQVLPAIRELGFSANAHARGLALGHSNFLGILIFDTGANRRVEIGA